MKTPVLSDNLLPFVALGDQAVLPDAILADFYAKIVMENLTDQVFYDQSVKAVSEFIAFVKDPNRLVVFGVEDNELVAMGWLNEMYLNHACAHFVFLKEHWGRHKTVAMGQAANRYWLTMPAVEGMGREYLFQVLLGFTPADNPLALNYIKQVGYQQAGTVPHMAMGRDMVISYITLELLEGKAHGR
jgi:uncharacterized protein YaaQ